LESWGCISTAVVAAVETISQHHFVGKGERCLCSEAAQRKQGHPLAETWLV